MSLKLKLIIVCVSLFQWVLSCSIFSATRFEKPKNLQINYDYSKDAIRVSWDEVVQANQYKIKLIKKKSKRVLRKTKTKDLSIEWDASTLKKNKKYQIKVKALKNNQMKASRWKKKQYIHYEAPIFTNVLNSLSLNDAQTWLFAIDDGKDELALSAEKDNTLIMGRWNLSSPSTVTWQTILTSTDLSGNAISDHWHLYAHHHHWIVVSTQNARVSYLLQLDQNFNQVSLQKVADYEISLTNGDIPTNDMFMVDEADGLAIGHYEPPTGHRLFRFDSSANALSHVDIGGDDFNHGNGSSAILYENRFVLLATENIDETQDGKISLMSFDSSWNEIQSETLLEKTGKNFSQATGVFLDSGILVTYLREVDTSSLDDLIVRYTVSPNGDILSRAVIAENEVHRPHTTLLENQQIVLAWDPSGSGTVKMRIDSYSE